MVVEVLLATPRGRRVAERLRSPELSLHAPHLLDVEVAQALRRYAAAGTIPVARARLALRHLAELDVERWAHEPLLPRIWALRENLTAYDATYVALAEALPATLLTADERLARAPGLATRVERIG